MPDKINTLSLNSSSHLNFLSLFWRLDVLPESGQILACLRGGGWVWRPLLKIKTLLKCFFVKYVKYFIWETNMWKYFLCEKYWLVWPGGGEGWNFEAQDQNTFLSRSCCSVSHNLLLAPTDFHSAHAIVLLSIAVRVSLDMTQWSHQTDKPETIATSIRISSSLCVTAGPACIAYVYMGRVTYSIVFHTGCWHNSCEVHLEKEDENCTD